jgi:carbonic anhydrase
MTSIDDLLHRNQGYAAGYSGADLTAPPSRRLAIVACMDARLDPLAVLGLRAGEAHVIRNAGGVITQEVIRSLTISQTLLGTEEIVLIHHTDCGMQKFTDESFQAILEDEVGRRASWAPGFFSEVELGDAVRAALTRVRSSPYLPHTDRVRGFVWEVESGLLREVT